jgi:hypothetical protein
MEASFLALGLAERKIRDVFSRLHRQTRKRRDLSAIPPASSATR